jgi:hypothetical protein
MSAQSKRDGWMRVVRLLAVILLFALALPTQGAQPTQAEALAQATNLSGNHLVTGLFLSHASPNIQRTGQSLTVDFQYNTIAMIGTTGVRIDVRPYTNGAPSPNASLAPSPLYPVDSGGKGSTSFTITTGTVVVDELRVQMWNGGRTVLLFESTLPVFYYFSDASSLAYNFVLESSSPNVLLLDQELSFSFDYLTREADGVRIFGRPFSAGQETPNSAAHNSPLYPAGGGSGSGRFTVTSGQVVVDALRVQVLSQSSAAVLLDVFLPVYYRFKPANHSVYNLQPGQQQPNILKFSQDLAVGFSYRSDQAGGVQVLFVPFSGSWPTPNQVSSASPVYSTGTGAGSASFRIASQAVVVDKVRVQMWSVSDGKLLFETFLPVHLFWAGDPPPPGPDIRITAIEVTQAIQDLNNSVELVAGKRTYVRVHASAPTTVQSVHAALSGRRGLIYLPSLSSGNRSAGITLRPLPNRAQINDSFLFELPDHWTADGLLTLTARIDPNNALNDQDLSDNTLSTTVRFYNVPPLKLKQINVQYRIGENIYQSDGFHLEMLESWLRRAYPISDLQALRRTYVYPTAGAPNVNTLHGYMGAIRLFNILYNGEDPRTVYYGVVDETGGFMRGKALAIPGVISAGPSGASTFNWDFDGSYNDWYGGHEIAHNMGRYHAEFCGAQAGTDYPYWFGRISPTLSGSAAIYGFDIETRQIYGPNWKDVMTYCEYQWISDFTYEGIRDHLVTTGLLLAQATTNLATANEFLLVVGLADLVNNTVDLTSVQRISQRASIPLPLPGDWDIVLLNSGGGVLASHPFAPLALSDTEGETGAPAMITELIPFPPGATRVEIRRDGATLAGRSASATPPAVQITAPSAGSVIPAGSFQVSWTGSDPDGDSLTYSLLLSRDGGQSWETFQTGLVGGSVTLNTVDLPGGEAYLRVIASDGFLTAQAEVGPVKLPINPPQPLIAAPQDGQVFFPAQAVTLNGSAYDPEDGTLDGAALTWSSDVAGELGSGASLNTTLLATGEHVITLTATDSDGLSSKTEVKVTIGDENLGLPAELVVAPAGIGVVAPFTSGPQEYEVSLRSLGESELNWTAFENLPWLDVSLPAGQTPVDALLTFTPGSLAVGKYHGTITFTSPQAVNSPVTLPVTLQVTGRALFLPLMLR